ncbi:MAG TPA: hypothetical protein VFB54_05615 [Burkholderiales bacterium]|nr:hypothetical protein [Burkholderiales bacterium]
MKITRWVAALAALPLASAASAHDLTIDECIEGGEFIQHAAMSRDSGLSREAFLGQMQADLIAIQAFPPQLRWFVQDEADATLLVSQAEQVFDDPRAPDHHRSDFLHTCFDRIQQQSALRSGARADAGREIIR